MLLDLLFYNLCLSKNLFFAPKLYFIGIELVIIFSYYPFNIHGLGSNNSFFILNIDNSHLFSFSGLASLEVYQFCKSIDPLISKYVEMIACPFSLCSLNV